MPVRIRESNQAHPTLTMCFAVLTASNRAQQREDEMPEKTTTRFLIRGDIRKLSTREKHLLKKIKKIRKAIGPVEINSGKVLRRFNER